MIILPFPFTELDWLFGWMVADRCSVLGNGRVFVKKMLKYVPGMSLARSVPYEIFFILFFLFFSSQLLVGLGISVMLPFWNEIWKKMKKPWPIIFRAWAIIRIPFGYLFLPKVQDWIQKNWKPVEISQENEDTLFLDIVSFYMIL